MAAIEDKKDEAYRYIETGIQALTEGKFEKAEKFLLMAEKLYPTQKAKEALEQIRSILEAEFHSEPEYTPQQLEAVRKLKKCRNYYEVLGITKESNDYEIRKAYKKLALQLHPDKNKAPGAAEAFLVIGNAAVTLTDCDMRKEYDSLHNNEPSNQHDDSQNSGAEGTSRGHTNNEFCFSRFEFDISAEEIFKYFFGVERNKIGSVDLFDCDSALTILIGIGTLLLEERL